jgi:hypothetical protein
MLNLDDPEIIAQIRRRDEYMNASHAIPFIFQIRPMFNKNINSYGLKHKVEEYNRKHNPNGYNYCDADSLTIAMLDMGYKCRLENKKDKSNPNYIFNVKVI